MGRDMPRAVRCNSGGHGGPAGFPEESQGWDRNLVTPLPQACISMLSRGAEKAGQKAPPHTHIRNNRSGLGFEGILHAHAPAPAHALYPGTPTLSIV